MLDRERVGREASPTGGVLDSQSVKAPAARQRGFDGGKKITGRKRHVAVDTDGRLLMINLTTAEKRAGSMEQESPDDPIPSREEVEALRAAIVSRDDLVDFLDALIEHMEHDKSTWSQSVEVTLRIVEGEPRNPQIEWGAIVDDKAPEVPR